MRVNFVGDIGIFKRYEQSRIDPFKEIELPEADLNIGNFEFVITDRKKQFYDVQERYSCSLEYLKHLRLEKFDGMGLGNNHAMDYGFEGAKDTIQMLESRGIEVFGFSDDNSYRAGTFVHQGISMGVIAFVKEGRWSKRIHGKGPDTYDVDKVCAEIHRLKKEHDHVIIFPHWGTELVEVPDSFDRENARKFIDAGASAVIGHHPHISQGIEWYNRRLIAYSLGSFIYIPEEELGYIPNQNRRDVSICLNIELNKETISSAKPHYYKYDPKSLLPRQIEDKEIEQYSAFLDQNIWNDQLYSKQVKSGLVRREIRSFLLRFRSAPARTIIGYLKLLTPSRLKKLIGR